MGAEAPGAEHARVGLYHFAWEMESFEELKKLYQEMKQKNVNIGGIGDHGISIGVYFFDPDGNEVEIMMDNYTPLETQDYKRHYQGTEDFGASSEGEYDFGKLVELYESGVPDTVRLDREEIKRRIKDGTA